ncbi:Snf1 kinase interactor-like protein [Hirschfeldia incana]|nr:Snf1 kinase interactor-like protein [Hirschfeldia incana]KAJ0256674.1 Snf1 kinase interactor-like protein [Hirschfeldia incana]KAJ0256675.1 Snf1 kinase interactor-like protein [Hirschfeldia incana]
MVKGNGFEGDNTKKETVGDGFVGGFFPVSTTKIAWKSRKRSASVNPDKAPEAAMEVTPEKDETTAAMETDKVGEPMTTTPPVLSEKRKALFEPLEPITNLNGKRPTDADSLLPPPDFESAIYPKGWLIGKKRKLVNVDVVESMRRIAVQEMNRKDREIDGLNEQLEEDSRCLEHLQLQLLQERSKRTEIERENTMLKEQVDMLVNMIQQDEEEVAEEEP